MSLPVKAHPNTLASTRTLVVGGTSGLGAAVVSGLLAHGGSVHVSSSNPDRISAKISEFRSLYPDSDATAVSGTAADMSYEGTLEANVRRVLDEAIEALGGPLDHLVYTAGEAFAPSPLSEVDGPGFFKGWNVRYLGPLLFAKTIAANPGKYLKVAATSSITLTSGVLAHKPVPGVSHFVGWAGAIEATARGLAVDLAPVRVNAVAPGAFHTEMLNGLGDAGIQSFGAGTLVKRVGTPAEGAEMYLYSMRSAFLTGELIKMDGGAVLA